MQFWKKVICHRIPVQTLICDRYARHCRQDGVENRDKVYLFI